MSLLKSIKKKYLKMDMNYLFKQGGWTTIHFFFSSVMAFLIQILVVNTFSKEDYGKYQYAVAVSGTIMSFSLQGVRLEMIKQVSLGNLVSFPSANRLLEKFTLLLAVCHFVVAGYYYFDNNFDYAWLLLIVGMSAPAISLYNTYSGYLQGIKDFRANATYQLVSIFVTCLATLAAVLLSKNIIIFALCSQGTNAVVNYFLNRKVIRESGLIVPDKESERQLFKFGGHLSAAGVLGSVASYFDKIILNHLSGPASVATLAISSALANRAKLFVKSTSIIIFPKIAEKNIDAIRASFHFRTLQTFILGAVCAFILFIITPTLFSILYPKYHGDSHLAKIMSFEVLFLFMGSYHATILKGHGMLKPLYILTTANGTIKLVCLFLGAYFWQLEGVVWSRVGVGAITASLVYIYLMNHLSELKNQKAVEIEKDYEQNDDSI